ncbi:DUF4743 domain-containing protein [Pusillimonas sp. CC-YST705]|uniref:DUF4743 domain-containing protein n=1 Tax=Mesopusillimonas faecipullorum TaxID=2755040 RepID=A0ABS8C9Q2_9BURK|nr:DUF4743 domain-containing protein [Mesopusillimonas faecipullorum]MCB5362738.1 DUF4743 domain-containing protein [Mesopusillimonas faecipullorum]
MKLELAHSLRADLEIRKARLIPRIQQLPPARARPLVIQGRVAGWVMPRAAQAMAGLAGVSIHYESVTLAPQAKGGGVDAMLAQVAQTLQDAGCLRSWRDELLDVVGEGSHLGCMERGAFRPLGLLTRAVHLNAWTPKGELWIALRASTKSTDPGMWDTLAGGLAAAGETLEDSLLRESHEEAGLEADLLLPRTPLRLVSRLHKRLPEGYQVEDALVSDCVLPEGVTPRNLDGEVDAFQTADMDTLWELLKTDAFTVEAEWVILDSLLR